MEPKLHLNAFEPLKITQGASGDCYLLASLDCFFQSKEGRLYIENMFSEGPNGEIIVKIKPDPTLRNNLLHNLIHFQKQGEQKLNYKIDAGYDVFTLDKNRVEQIKHNKNARGESSSGVQTNSLAVKILERLSPYYSNPKTNVNRHRPEASVVAHDNAERHHEAEGSKNTSTEFIKRLFDTPVFEATAMKDGEENKLAAICLAKQQNPDLPLYISMAWGEKDNQGRTHERHALRVESVRENNGHYELVLKNPHDNSTEHIFSLQEVQKRDCRLCVFNPNQAYVKDIDNIKKSLIENQTKPKELEEPIEENQLNKDNVLEEKNAQELQKLRGKQEKNQALFNEIRALEGKIEKSTAEPSTSDEEKNNQRADLSALKKQAEEIMPNPAPIRENESNRINVAEYQPRVPQRETPLKQEEKTEEDFKKINELNKKTEEIAPPDTLIRRQALNVIQKEAKQFIPPPLVMPPNQAKAYQDSGNHRASNKQTEVSRRHSSPHTIKYPLDGIQRRFEEYMANALKAIQEKKAQEQLIPHPSTPRKDNQLALKNNLSKIKGKEGGSADASQQDDTTFHTP